MIKYEIGEKIGDLTIIQNWSPSTHGDRQFMCQCACGTYVVKKATVLRQVAGRGYTASCGCRRKIKKAVDISPTII